MTIQKLKLEPSGGLTDRFTPLDIQTPKDTKKPAPGFQFADPERLNLAGLEGGPTGKTEGFKFAAYTPTDENACGGLGPVSVGEFRKSATRPAAPSAAQYRVGDRVRLRHGREDRIAVLEQIGPASNGQVSISARWPGGSCTGLYNLSEISAAA